MPGSCLGNDSIEVVGICQDFPNNCQGAFTQLKVPEIINIPERKPDIEQIIQVLITGRLISSKIVETPVGESVDGQILTGEKLAIEGKLRQKIVYVADVEEENQPVHSAEFDIFFSTYVVVPECYVGTIPSGKEDQINVQICVEDLFIEEVSPRQVLKNSMLFINAIFPPEEVPPTADIIEPADGDTFTIGDSVIIRADVSDNDDCLLDKVEIEVEEVATGEIVDEFEQSLRGENNAEVTHIWDTTGLDAGDYTITVTAIDCEDNVTEELVTVILV
ncbi:Ig-like domain-containing protein [Sporohalobacter salinus]|uniref:Ig-like domain-containing protein n=1 Tax=Sporohalobacter salinus TaxID=1494606 RepID=UPI001961CC6A|nr:Ig-like domain-containing protein [Sporohalobacter salinus]MBM7625142.1 hypothetical protein [Sporohalobacter salinus]